MTSPDVSGGSLLRGDPARARADYFLPHLVSLPLHRALLRSVEARLLARYQYERPLLDVGCGDGHFASVLFPDGVDVGIDPSPASIEECRKRGIYRDLRVAGAGQLPFPDESFASVMSNCVLEHIPDLDGALDEIARVLRPGGLLVLTVPSPNYERFLLGSSVFGAVRLNPLSRAYGRWMTRISYHYHYYWPEEWQQRLAARGLVVREWQYYFSPAAHRLFDLSHYLSSPSLLVRKLTGRWILFPGKPGTGLQRSWLNWVYEEATVKEGAYIQMACVKQPSSGDLAGGQQGD